MNRAPSAPVGPLPALLLGLTAGVGAGLLAVFLGLISHELVPAFSSEDVVGADIGAGLIAMAVTLVGAPFSAWPLSRLFRLPHPLAMALLSLPFHLAFAVVLLSVAPAVEDLLRKRASGFAEATSPALPWYALDIVGIALAVALSALLVALRHRRGASPGTPTPTTP